MLPATLPFAGLGGWEQGLSSPFAARLPILALLSGNNSANRSRYFPPSEPTARVMTMVHGPSTIEAKAWYEYGLPRSRGSG